MAACAQRKRLAFGYAVPPGGRSPHSPFRRGSRVLLPMILLLVASCRSAAIRHAGSAGAIARLTYADPFM